MWPRDNARARRAAPGHSSDGFIFVRRPRDPGTGFSRRLAASRQGSRVPVFSLFPIRFQPESAGLILKRAAWQRVAISTSASSPRIRPRRERDATLSPGRVAERGRTRQEAAGRDRCWNTKGTRPESEARERERDGGRAAQQRQERAALFAADRCLSNNGDYWNASFCSLSLSPRRSRSLDAGRSRPRARDRTVIAPVLAALRVQPRAGDSPFYRVVRRSATKCAPRTR